MSKTIAIIGAGPVGRALASGLMSAGHAVSVGVREPSAPKHDDLRSIATVTTMGSAVESASVVVLAVPADSLGDVVPSLTLVPGQIVADATNAVFTPLPDGFETLGHYTGSLLPPGVGLVKAFNTVGAEHLSGGAFEQATFLPIAGDADATELVGSLAEDLGLEVADLGGRDEIGQVESHARLWIHLALKKGWGRNIAWTITRR